MESNIKQLQEMGFSTEQAENALKHSQNDLEQAIAYLFDDTGPVHEVPIQEQYSGEYIENTVQISNTEDIPEIYPLTAGASSYEPSNKYSEWDQKSNLGDIQEYVDTSKDEKQRDEFDDYNDDDDGKEDKKQQQLQQQPSIFDRKEAFVRAAGMPPVVLPKEKATAQGYVTAMYIILSQIHALRDRVLKEDVPQEYLDNWFNDIEDQSQGETIANACESEESNGVDSDDHTDTKSTNSDSSENLVQQSRNFIRELQRIIGFLTPISNRAFISSNSLCETLPAELFSPDIEDWDEALSHIDRQLAAVFKSNLMRSNDQAISKGKLFVSEIETEDDMFSEVRVFEVDGPVRGGSVCETFNNLLWNENNYKLLSVAPVLAIQINADERDMQPVGLSVERHFHPSIYGPEYQHLILDMRERKLAIGRERTNLTSQIMSLSSFEGSKIRSVLECTQEYLAESNEKEASRDVANLAENMKNMLAQLNEKVLQVAGEYAKLDPNNHENILNQITENKEYTQPDKFAFTAAVFSDDEYIYKLNHSLSSTTTSTATSTTASDSSDEWVLFDATSHGSSRIDSYVSQYMSFEEAREYIYKETSRPNRSVLLLYVNEDLVHSTTSSSLPERLVEFFRADNKELAHADESSQAHAQVELRSPSSNVSNGEVSLSLSSTASGPKQENIELIDI